MVENQGPANSESIFCRERVILLSVGLAVVSWLGEYAAHLLVFDTADQGAGLFPTEPNELWMRTLVAGLIIAFGLFVRSSVQNLSEARVRLVAHKADLESQVLTRTAELAQTNRQLQKELNDRVYLESQLDKHRHHLEELLEQRAGELKTTNKHLRQEINEKQRAEEELRESEQRFRRLSEAAFESIFITNQGIITECNNQAAEMFGYSVDELMGMQVHELVAPESRTKVREHIERGFEERYKHMALKKDGTIFPVEVHGRTYPHNGRNFRVTAIADLTDQVKADQEILMANQISEAKQVALREKNLALKHVLGQLDSEKQEIKAQIQANVDRIVMPTLRLLRKKVDSGAAEFVDLLDTSLKEIASPLANRLQNSYSSLSPGEIEICSMIRNGLASKEIAEFRGVSVQTISMQRKRIRRKLGIAHQAVSLPALLNSLTD